MTSAAELGGSIRSFTTEGRRFAHSVEPELGQTTANPLVQPRLEAKLLDCAQRGVSRGAIERVMALDRLEDAGEPIGTLSRGGG